MKVLAAGAAAGTCSTAAGARSGVSSCSGCKDGVAGVDGASCRDRADELTGVPDAGAGSRR